MGYGPAAPLVISGSEPQLLLDPQTVVDLLAGGQA
jgi:hypothetical protein